jgi:membrane-associated phospholipid phosphatase
MASGRFWKGARVVTAEMVGTMVVFTGAVAGLVFLLRPRMRRHKQTDLAIFDWVKQHTNDRNTAIMWRITKLADHRFLVPANLTLIAYFLFLRKRSWFSIRVATVALSSLALMFIFKKLFRRKRPLEPLLKQAKGLSFPSGHALMSITFYGLLIYISWHTINNRPLKALLILSMTGLVGGIGYSRVYLRVHYASDVAVGFTIGLCWLIISLDLLKRIETFNKQQGILPPQPVFAKGDTAQPLISLTG